MPLTMADALITQRTKGSNKLEKISNLVNWKYFEYRLDNILNRSNTGRIAYDNVKMFVICLLQRLYNLLDPEMKEMLYDHLSFRRRL